MDNVDNNEKGSYNLLKGERDGKPWIAIMRDKFLDYENKSDFNWLLQVHIDAEANNIGLVSDEEAAILNILEDFLNKKILSVAQMYFVGRITWNGIRSLYYYVSDPKPIAEELNKTISQGQYTREFQYEISKDTEWKKILELVPNVENI